MKKVPEILHVCRESRALGLQLYSLGFEFPREFERGIPLNPIGESTFTGVYYNQSKDLLSFSFGDPLN
jgi:hypothetical protein